MKKVLFLLAMTCLVAGAAIPDRRVKIGPKAGTLTAANTEIVVAADAPRTTRFAGEELQKLLSKVLGGAIPVVAKPSDGKTAFILGHNEFSKELKADTSTPESYVIRNTPNRIYILGDDDPKANPLDTTIGAYHNRSTLLGVYDWLERFAGVRFYCYGEFGTIIPKTASLDFPEADIFERPDYAHRRVAQLGSTPGASGKEALNSAGRAPVPSAEMRKYNTLRWRLETRYVPNCHGQNFLGYMERFGKSHPEYFALDANGKRNDASTYRPHLCYSSGAREELYQDMIAWFKGEPAASRGVTFRGKHQWYPTMFRLGYFNMMPEDSFKKCHCEKCLKEWTDTEQYASEFLWKFIAECGNRLKKDNIPGIITMMAYYPYRAVPSVEIPDNVLVMLAETGPWGMNNAEQQARDNAEVRAWAKKVSPNKIWLWVYLCKFGNTAFPNIPSPTPKATGDYFKAFGPVIDGAYLEGETDRFINNDLAFYVFARLAWNNDLDPQALIAEHHKLMFGAGAAEMAKVFDRAEKLWLTKIVGRITFNELGPLVSPPSENELWGQIYTEQEVKAMKDCFARAAKFAAKDPAASRRIELFRQEWLVPLMNEREAYCRRVDALKDLKLSAAKPAFLRRFGKPGEPTDVRTKVSFAREGGNLVFTFDCEEPQYDLLAAVERQHDDRNVWRDSGVELFLNPSGDRKNIVQIIVNKFGSLSDLRFVLDGVNAVNSDWSYETGASARAEKTADGYRVTISVPEKNLPDFRAEGVPANFSRTRALPGKTGGVTQLYSWGNALKRFNDAENFGMLQFAETPDKNLVDNPDFTAAPTQKGKCYGAWYGEAPVRFTETEKHALDRSTFVTGGQSVMLASGGPNFHLTQNLKPFKPSTRYRLSYYVKLDKVVVNKRGGGVYVEVFDGRKLGYPRNPLSGTTDWIKQSFEFTTPEKVSPKPYMMLRMLFASGTAWFDHVEITEAE